MDVRDDEWTVISNVLEEIEHLLRQAGDPGADRIADLRVDAERDRSAAVAALTSGDMWNHMGSFFDRSLADRRLDREFRQAQIRLADALDTAHVATRDVQSWATVLRTWESQGV